MNYHQLKANYLMLVRNTDILNFLKENYVKLTKAKWLSEHKEFVEFHVDKLGSGIYSVLLKQVILSPGAYSNFEYDKKMGWIVYRRILGNEQIILNVKGNKLDFSSLK